MPFYLVAVRVAEQHSTITMLGIKYVLCVWQGPAVVVHIAGGNGGKTCKRDLLLATVRDGYVPLTWHGTAQDPMR